MSPTTQASNGKQEHESGTADRESGTYRIARNSDGTVKVTGPVGESLEMEDDSPVGQCRYQAKKVDRFSKQIVVNLVDAQHSNSLGDSIDVQIDAALEAIAKLRDHARVGQYYVVQALAERRVLRARIAELETALAAALKNAREFDEVRAQLAKVTTELSSLRGETAPVARKVVALPNAARRSKGGAR